MDLERAMRELSRERPIFHSEADFQHALAWKIHEIYPRWKIRLERRLYVKGRKLYVDIYIQNDHIFIVELKYKTRGFIYSINGERYVLKDQSAQDIDRYDFVKDISRIEECVEEIDDSYGYAIFLTNDPNYWRTPIKEDSIDRDFRIHDGRMLHGELKWSERASKGTTMGREKPIILKGRYRIRWRDYSNLGGRYGRFRYILLPIDRKYLVATG